MFQQPLHGVHLYILSDRNSKGQFFSPTTTNYKRTRNAHTLQMDILSFIQKNTYFKPILLAYAFVYYIQLIDLELEQIQMLK